MQEISSVSIWNTIHHHIISDHKPLEVIINNPRHQTSVRLQRILVRVMDYDFKVQYRPGKTSDYTFFPDTRYHMGSAPNKR